jgi:hypothetical protein
MGLAISVLGAFQQPRLARLERKEPATGVFDLHSVTIHKDFLP